jgi:hypothetical protein
MADYTESVTTGYFSRIGKSITGILFGGLMFLVAFPILFMNEGCAVRAYDAITEGKGAVVETALDKVDSATDKKLVHVSGPSATDEVLRDDEFNVQAPGIHLERHVEMYQWKEESRTKTRKNLGGSETRETVYDYEKAWSTDQINSDNFNEGGKAKYLADHSVRIENPAFPFSKNQKTAQRVTLGAHVLTDVLVSSITSSDDVPANAAMLAELPEDKKKLDIAGAQRTPSLTGAKILFSANPEKPQVGDMRVWFTVVKPTTVSVLAQQEGDTFGPYVAKSGNSLYRLEEGTLSAAEMLKHMENETTTLLWLVRAGGFMLMFFGLSMMMAPLSVLADVVPFIGSLVGMGTSLIAGLLAGFFALTTIAIAWLIYHPLIGGVILAVAIGCLALLFFLRGKKQPAPAGM